MKLKVNANLNVRVGKPSLNAPCYQYLAPGSILEVDGNLYPGDKYDGINTWYKDEAGNYYWSGGVEEINSNIVKEFIKDQYWWLKDYGIQELWKFGLTGKGIKIAILDSGLSLPHPDLNIELSQCIDVSENNLNSINDKTGHGTHCTGIIAASNNGFGVKGIAYDSEIYFCKITNDEVGDNVYYLNKGLEWAINNKVDIISISQGYKMPDKNLEILLNKANELNIIVVCSGGNQSNLETFSDILYPAKYNSTIAVGAIDQTKKVVERTIYSDNLNIMAPGSEIYSTFLNSSYKSESGSSQAAAYVSGVIALFLQKYKQDNITISLDIKTFLQNKGDLISGMNVSIINPLKIIGL